MANDFPLPPPTLPLDMQMVNITIRVLSKPDASQLRWIFRTLGKDYDERILPSIVNEVSKAVVAKYNAAELLTKREMVSSQIRLQLEKRAKEFRIVLDDVSITHLTFSREYTNAVEAKQVGTWVVKDGGREGGKEWGKGHKDAHCRLSLI